MSLRIDVGKGLRDVAQVGVDQDRAQRHQDPGPGPERVVHHIEKEGAGHRVLFTPGREHSLRDVAPAPRLGAGIPDRPPLNRDRDQEHRQRHRPVAEVRQQVEGVGGDLPEQPRQPADRRLRQREVRRREAAGQGDAELDRVGDQHPPEPRHRGEEDRDDRADHQRPPHRPAQHDVGDLGGGEVDRRHDDAVEQEAQVDRPEAAEHRRRLPRVADLVELEVGQHPRAAPELGVEEDGGHSRQQERPPEPVLGHPALPDHVGDEIRGVGAERRGDHGNADQPPGRGPARGEEFGGAGPRALGEEEGGEEGDDDGDGDDDPVDRREVHRGSGRKGPAERYG